MKTTLRRLASLLCLLGALAACQGDAGNIVREQPLLRGVNLQLASNTAHEDQATGRIETPASSDLRRIRELGLDHVRIR